LKFDLNYRLPEPMGGFYPNFDWTHFNTVDYVEATDQILLNSRNFSETYLVNHKTGAVEWRWGNKSAYGQGKAPSWYDNGDQKIFGSHNATPLENGNIQIFDNGSERPERNSLPEQSEVQGSRAGFSGIKRIRCFARPTLCLLWVALLLF
jgi:hypothetical protein